MDQQTNDLIKNEIENNEVCLFMKGTPECSSMWIFNGNLKYFKNTRSKF